MTLTELFTNIADAIRTKKGTSDKILASDFATEIENLPSGGVEKINITNAYYMCYSRDELVKNANILFDFTECTDFRYTFYNCKTLETIPLINTGNGTSFLQSFRGCTSLKTIPLLNTSKCTSFESCFYECTSLETIPLINTENGTSFSTMFRDCTSLKTIPLINTENGTSFSSMFNGCTKLNNVPELNTIKSTTFNGMFNNCKSLKTLSNLKADNCKDITSMLNNCSALENFGGLSNIGKAYTTKSNNYSYYTLKLTYSTKITHDSLMNVINNLYDLNLTYNVANGGTLYTQSLNLGSTNKAKLTAEEIAIATSKRMVDFIKEELNMQYIGYTKPILLVADEGKKIREINDVYIPATEEEPEHIPYYTDVVFLADGITEQQAFEMYVEEVVE